MQAGAIRLVSLLLGTLSACLMRRKARARLAIDKTLGVERLFRVVYGVDSGDADEIQID